MMTAPMCCTKNTRCVGASTPQDWQTQIIGNSLKEMNSKKDEQRNCTAVVLQRSVTGRTFDARRGTRGPSSQRLLPAGCACLRKTLADTQQKAVADLAIGGELLLAAAVGGGRVLRR